MDSTLILITTLRVMRDYQQTIDSLAARITELEAALPARDQRIVELEERLATAVVGELPPGWRLVRETA